MAAGGKRVQEYNHREVHLREVNHPSKNEEGETKK